MQVEAVLGGVGGKSWEVYPGSLLPLRAVSLGAWSGGRCRLWSAVDHILLCRRRAPRGSRSSRNAHGGVEHGFATQTAGLGTRGG